MASTERGKLLANIGSGFKRILHGDKPDVVTPFGKILPESVRYTLQYGNAQFIQDGKPQPILGVSEMNDLLHSGFVNETIYLTLRALDEDKIAQQEYLATIVKHFASGATPQHLVRTLDAELHKRPTLHTQGAKLVQINRQGFELWHDRYLKMASTIHDLPDKPSPVIIAYASFLGLTEFIETFKDTDISLFLAMPKWITNVDENYFGYRIDMKEDQKVTLLAKTEQRPSNVVTAIGTHKTGTMERDVWNFWFAGKTTPDPKGRQFAINFYPPGAKAI